MTDDSSDDNSKENTSADSNEQSLEIRQFNIREADWERDSGKLSNIRRIVFIVEQNVPQEEEWDGKDEDSWHWIATDAEEIPIGTARLLPDGQIGRMAVLSEYRTLGVGAALLEAAVEKARHLGMKDVFLNAQSHALGFYERSGFVAEGDEFDEAGIPHYRMTLDLPPPADNIQRRAAVDSDLTIDVRPFDTAEVNWPETKKFIKLLRRQVFVNEQHLPDEVLEQDEDASAIHWVAENDDGHLIGTLQMTPDGNVSRLAVQERYRHLGVGHALLELAIQRARRFGLPELHLLTPEDTAAFFEDRGFEVDGEETKVFGQPCVPMTRLIDPEDRTVEKVEEHGEMLAEGAAYKLGEDKQLILLRREEDFRNVIQEMTRQARKSIKIYSPNLSHDLFDNSELLQTCSRLARRNKYTSIEILVFDPHRIVKNGHALLTISRKLPSSIGIKIVDPEMRQQFHEFVIVDGEGVIYRPEYDQYEGTAQFLNITEANRLTRLFSASWESGLLDPNLRQLRI